MVSFEFFIYIILLAALWRYSASDKNVGYKGYRYAGLTTLRPSSADFLEIREPKNHLKTFKSTLNMYKT
jgi:hypothetical protein